MTTRPLALFAIGLIFGGGLGFAFAASSNAAFEPHDHGDPVHHAAMSAADMTAHAARHDAPLEVDGARAPSVKIAVKPDPMAGWNLHVVTKDFTFAPDQASGHHVPGQGHAHVYANGVKLSRLYGPWMHLDTLPLGHVEIEVTLTSNDHRPLTVGGEPVAAKTEVTVE